MGDRDQRMTIEELTKKLEALIAERNNFMDQAANMIARYEGRIATYQEWLADLHIEKAPVDKKVIDASDTTG